MERIEKTMTSGELVAIFRELVIPLMKEEGYIMVKADEWKQESLKDKILKKKWITLKEIADSKIWGVGTKTSVERIIKDEDIDLDARKPPFKVHRLEVERIAKNRNTI